ncbi:MAG: hypothetical protein ACT6S0_04075 [Roseateles sp.]|uniref:Nucleotidyl transferase AbiEii/AbiGii toxin family protein n=1 Tax=Roseateles asaccharophilus TaxID=582607 RepID=A0ABU2AF58_9BURK|nr:hypothetical protein [Roseateles asaccharophilus]MDR7335851.1 hypothetical protein [Roseateles asaccharophilus]
MIKGLDAFTKAFADWTDQYVLIGGTAATLTMQDQGLKFRATKDLDVVLIVEALTADFGRAFWDFIKSGGYEIQQASETGKRSFYRFIKPSDASFPVMIELFARAPDALRPIAEGHLTPIPLDEDLSSLSAILLDDEFYAFILDDRTVRDGLVWVNETRLIPLKAAAWVDMTDRRRQGAQIDSDSIRKHGLDILRLSQLLSEGATVTVAGRVEEALRRFLAEFPADAPPDPKTLKINAKLDDILGRVAAGFGLA